eukprot:TRINITY_DN8173_c0_g1_i1.p1 TRINITY_DN8173_c0_g1~~TRINITY_DN8173_c0_g1_i1.p1  ORF type:complete len:387 (+),score=87.48 TRINITY_DN8173_c0_g1_i1:1-1161(+)
MDSSPSEISKLKAELDAAMAKIVDLERRHRKDKEKIAQLNSLIKSMKTEGSHTLAHSTNCIQSIESDSSPESRKKDKKDRKDKKLHRQSREAFDKARSGSVVSSGDRETEKAPVFGIRLHKPKTVFGTRFNDLINKDGALAEDKVPYIVLHCVKYLDDKLHEEGLFRISGEFREIAILKTLYEKEERFESDVLPIEFESIQNHNSVSGLLEAFFNESPSPILESTDEFLAACDIPDVATRTKRYCKLVKSLPEVNQGILKIILPFIYKIRQHSESNKMTAMNLGVCFGPLFLQLASNPNVNPLELRALMTKQSRIVEELVAFSSDFFPSSAELAVPQHHLAASPSPSSQVSQVFRKPTSSLPPVPQKKPVAVSTGSSPNTSSDRKK